MGRRNEHEKQVGLIQLNIGYDLRRLSGFSVAIVFPIIA